MRHFIGIFENLKQFITCQPRFISSEIYIPTVVVGVGPQVAVSVKQVERTAESLGCQIAADESAVIDAEPNRAATLYLGMDGTGIPTRAGETTGRKGKPKAGGYESRARTREVKLVTVWSAGRFDERLCSD